MVRNDPDGWPDISPMKPDLVIRLPAAMRLYVIVFAVIWCGGVLAGLIAAVANASAAAVVPAAMLAFGGYFMFHMGRLAVIGDHEGLTMRGYYRSRRISKVEIEGFRIGSGYYPFGKCIFALTRGDEVVALDVTRRAGLLPITRRRMDDQLSQLRQWLTTP